MRIRNIWQNDFYNESPVSKWAWEIDFSSFLPKDTIEVYKLDKYLKTLNRAIVSCVWGKREMSIVNTYFGGIQANFPGRVQNAGEINIKFNENQSMLVSQTLEILFNLQSHDQKYFNEGEGYTYDPLSMRYIKENVIRIRVKKPIYNVANEELDDNNVIALLEFHNCFIKGINEEELSYENMEDVLTRTVSISYDYMTYGKATETLQNNELEYAQETALQIEEDLELEKDFIDLHNENLEFEKEKQRIEKEKQKIAETERINRKINREKQATEIAAKIEGNIESAQSAQDAYTKAKAAADARNANQEEVMSEARNARMSLEQRGEQNAAQQSYIASQRAATEREAAMNEERAREEEIKRREHEENEKWHSRGYAKRS